MNTWPESAAVLTAGLGLVAAATAWRLAGALRQGLAVLLDFLTAAGLLRLAGTPSWDTIALAATVITLRKLLSASLTPSAPPRTRPARTRTTGRGRWRF
ncbi:hypothetical protein ACH4NF_01045 [Streptomyces sp. NPDC017248]|uniref:hypothetical protein n=1 Tax=unclassified Streptomyces TaxID=2593676 RepID=UPI003792E68A